MSECSIMIGLYKNLVGTINDSVSLQYGNEVSEHVANLVSTPPVSDKVGEVNKAVDYITKNCDVSEAGLKIRTDYNQNIYDSLDMYKNTTPHAIPEFGELSMIMVGLSFVGIVALTKRHEIYNAVKKISNRFTRSKYNV